METSAAKTSAYFKLHDKKRRDVTMPKKKTGGEMRPKHRLQGKAFHSGWKPSFAVQAVPEFKSRCAGPLLVHGDGKRRA